VSSLGDEEGSKEEKEVIQPHSAEGKATYSRRFFCQIYRIDSVGDPKNQQ
jgi:hypothetical protein